MEPQIDHMVIRRTQAVGIRAVTIGIHLGRPIGRTLWAKVPWGISPRSTIPCATSTPLELMVVRSYLGRSGSHVTYSGHLVYEIMLALFIRSVESCVMVAVVRSNIITRKDKASARLQLKAENTEGVWSSVSRQQNIASPIQDAEALTTLADYQDNSGFGSRAPCGT